MNIKHHFLIFLLAYSTAFSQKIDRRSVVSRHNVVIRAADSLSSLSVGNGGFAFTVDVTGLQSFPEYYKNGVSLGTQSDWGWHSLPNTENLKLEETYKIYNLDGKEVAYAVQSKNFTARQTAAANYFRENKHRLQLGNIGLDLFKKDGSRAAINDIKNINQSLDLWKGEIISRFTIEDVPVEVITCANPLQDGIAGRINSRLLGEGRIKIRIRFPYPSIQFLDEGTNFNDEKKHSSKIEKSANGSAIINHTLDSAKYFVSASWNGAAQLKEESAHYFTISPTSSGAFQFAVQFSEKKAVAAIPGFAATRIQANSSWQKFWASGGAVDFAGSSDPRAYELERRIILSQYLTRIQCAGLNPPQETGLTFNSWFGKPHMEMYWWHAAHFALWNRTELLEKSMGWYTRAAAGAKAIAKRQGYDGVRWQKMTDNDGLESPSSVGAFLIWQEPHVIYLAELIYRNRKSTAVLNKYKQLVFQTADFMASFPTYEKDKDRYNLGHGVIPAQECFNPELTFNPTYELAYWHWALNTAQDWRKRLGLPRNKKWDEVLRKLAPLPVKNGVYLATESSPDSYDADSKITIDHPAVLAAFSTIPAVHGLDTSIMQRTFDIVEKVWHWDHTWGWDFPLIAMTATRLNQPQAALAGLFKKEKTNTYLVNGHNYQDARLRIYLPGNGGILSAIALMCAGSDDNKVSNPGFPKDGSWKVKWEGLNKMP